MAKDILILVLKIFMLSCSVIYIVQVSKLIAGEIKDIINEHTLKN